MSEKNKMRGKNFRRQLFVSVSAAALLATTYAAGNAQAAQSDADRPLLWIELGGQLEAVSGEPELFTPPFVGLASSDNRNLILSAQRPPHYSTGEEAKITFQPEDSDWLLSASIRYGRSNTQKHFHRQTAIPNLYGTILGKYQTWYSTQLPAIFVDGQTSSREKHAVLDFQAGKDVGLGMFGGHGESTLSAGVRIAQFTASSNDTIHARPFVTHHYVVYTGLAKVPLLAHGTYSAIMEAKRDTHAIGPSISWDASLPLAGTASDAALSLDWGVNAAVLFGRQRARVHHQTGGYYAKALGLSGLDGTGQAKYSHRYTNPPVDQNRSRSVIIPNVGAFAGLSFRYADAKISLGYRGDFFFGAMDNGIDTRKSATRSFFGPFASISVGLGD